MVRPDGAITLKIVSIDPAPRRGLNVFDGADTVVPISASHAFVEQISRTKDVLLCWDAPLTGPGPEALRGVGVGRASDFTQRPIESFFSRREAGFRVPKGISVRGYSGCPHWAMSRSMLGLPRTGRWDGPLDELPFRLVSADGPRPTSGRWVVEIHPAVALWLWCKETWEGDWTYKSDTTIRDGLWAALCCVLPSATSLPAPRTDDELDARVGFLLGVAWVSGSPEVVLLGDLSRGTFLLPRVCGLVEAFEGFNT